jgi:anti-anti-sigma factor
MDIVTVNQRGTSSRIALRGRLDSMTAPAVQREVSELVLAGTRQLFIDLNGVSFVSSAGLRVFIAAQQQLSQVGGEVILVALGKQTEELLRVSGLFELFRVVASAEQTRPAHAGGDTEAISRTVGGVALEVAERPGAPGRLTVIGSAEKLARSARLT